MKTFKALCADDPEKSWTQLIWNEVCEEFVMDTADCDTEACSILSTADAKRLADFIYKHIGE